MKPDGVSYTTEKETGREQTEFIRSEDLWFRPIEDARRPGRRALRRRFLQPGRHPQRHARPACTVRANAAVRPDRDHYFGRIWRVQHKQATKLAVPVLNRADLARADSRHRDEPERARQENGLAAGAGELRVRSARSRRSRSRWAARRSRSTSGRAPRRPPAQRKAVLDTFAAATDNWTRSALVAAATEQASLYVASALAYERPQALDGVRGGLSCRQRCRRMRRSCSCSAAGAGAGRVALKAGVVRAVARMEGGAHRLDAATTPALQKLLDDPATTAAALPIVAKWDKAGALTAKADRQAQRCSASSATPTTSDDRRVEIAASLLAVPQRRSAGARHDRADAVEPRRTGRSRLA